MKNPLFFFVFMIASLNANAQSWVWGRQISGLGSNKVVNGYVVKNDECNNVFVSGIWKSDSIHIGSETFHNSDVGINNYQCYIAKYDSMGVVQWADASISGQAFPYGIANDKDGSTYLYGCFWTDSVRFGTHLLVSDYHDSCLAPCSWSSGCYFILKYDASGNIIWVRKGDNVMGAGGNIAIDDASNIYISGAYWNATMKIGNDTLHNSSYKRGEVFLAKYDPSGNVIWAKDYGDTSNEYSSGVAYANGRLYMTGQFRSPLLSLGSSVLHYHSFVPAYNIGGTYIMQLDTAGNPKWARSSVGSAVPQDIACDGSDGVYIGGQIYDTTYVSFSTDTFRHSHLRYAGFLVKYDTLGNLKWTNGIYNSTTTVASSGFGSGNRLWSIATDKCTNVWISGNISGDPGGIIIDSGVTLHAPSGSWDPLYVIGYNANGDLLQSLAISSGGNNGGKIGLASDRTGNVYLSSVFSSTSLIFGSDVLSSSGSWPMFLAKYNPFLGCTSVVCPGDDVVDIMLSKAVAGFALYPNPVAAKLTVTANDLIRNLVVTNLLGQKLYAQELNGYEVTFDVSHLPSGIYFVRINNSVSRKFLKQ